MKIKIKALWCERNKQKTLSRPRIQKLYNENVTLHKELSKQANIIDEVEKYQKERKNTFYYLIL